MIKIQNAIKYLCFLFFIKPFVFIVLGINVKKPENLPTEGPAILVANHNSHIDTLVLMCLYPIGKILKINPVAAEDYFFNTKFRRFIFGTLLGAIPLKRKREKFNREDIFQKVNENLANGHIIIVYPEGTRSMDHEIRDFKNGIAHLAKNNPDVPVVPIFISGPDKILPKYDTLLVPHICDVYIGEKNYCSDADKKEFAHNLKDRIVELKEEHKKLHRAF
jgi:1-acyl-sn-glycerol-3-phosphate acyltransferase